MIVREMVYFRDTNTKECWRNCEAFGWIKLSPDAFDDINDYSYRAFDTKPDTWLGDRLKNPMPRIAW